MLHSDFEAKLYYDIFPVAEIPHDRQKVDTNLQTARTCYTYEEFKQVISARKDKYGERLWNAGGTTVLKVNYNYHRLLL